MGTNSDDILLEAVGNLTGSRLDRNSCILRDVRLCGFKSKNGRDYSPAALKNALPLYEGVSVYVNHVGSNDIIRMPNSPPAIRRDARDKFGTIRNVRWDSRLGPIGNLHYNGGHSMRESFEWAADNDPTFYALSHDAKKGKSRRVGNRELIESISQVNSVDLVSFAATTGSLHESEMQPMNWRDAIAQGIAEILKDESIDPKAAKEKIDHLMNAVFEVGDGKGIDSDAHNPPEPEGEGVEGQEGQDMDKPKPEDAMESVRVAYPNDPNVAVLLESVQTFLTDKKMADVRAWAKGKGVPDDRLTEGVVKGLSNMSESLREEFVIPLRASNAVRSAAAPTIPAPAAKPGSKPVEKSADEIIKGLWG